MGDAVGVDVVGVLVVACGADVWVTIGNVGSCVDVGRVDVGDSVGKSGGRGGRAAVGWDEQWVLRAKGVNVGAEAWRVRSRVLRV
jgi:hypothetical protein